MKIWKNPEFTELNIEETAHDQVFGNYYDGGYFGDGYIGWATDTDPNQKPSNGGSANNSNGGIGNDMTDILS